MARKSARVLRIESELQRVLSDLISREVRDPRVGKVTIMSTDITPDMSEARVFFVPFGQAHAPAEVAAGLNRASGFLRGEAGRRLGLRHAPKLDFVFDDLVDRADHLTRLIDTAISADRSKPHSSDVSSGDASSSGAGTPEE